MGTTEDDAVIPAARKFFDAHRNAEHAVSAVFGDLRRTEDDVRFIDPLERALEDERATWIAAFGSPQLRELAKRAAARDATGRLVEPWLFTSDAVAQRVAAEWERSRVRLGDRPPGHEWAPLPSTADERPNILRDVGQKHTLRRATSEVESLLRARARYEEIYVPQSGSSKADVNTAIARSRTLHAKLGLAIERERKAWVRVHGSKELKRLDWFDDYGNPNLAATRQLGVEWLAKEYPGWSFVDGYRADGHRPILAPGSQFRPPSREPRDREDIEGAVIGRALDALLRPAKQTDPAAEIGILGWRKDDSSPARYVFAAVAKRRLPGSWVTEQVVSVFNPEQQRELNALIDLERERKHLRRDADLRCERLQREFGKPVLALARNMKVSGKLVRFEGREATHAIVETDRAVHCIRVRYADRTLVGALITLTPSDGKFLLARSHDRPREGRSPALDLGQRAGHLQHREHDLGR